MPRTKISEFSATPANNTDIDSINIAEGCAPSGINDAIRELMAQLKDFQTGAVGDSFNGPVNGTLGATTPATASVTTLAASGAVTLSGGTANGVTYLNGSKVLTSGSALTFDGTDLKFASGSGLFTNTSDGSDTGTLAIGGGGANSSARGGVIEFYGNENASAGVVDITSGNVANSYVRIQGRSSTSYVRFDINASEQMRLTSTGLGIGTSSPIFLTDILSGTANTGANVNNPSQLSVTGANKTLIGGGATVFVNSNSNTAIDTGGSIALTGRNTTSSTTSVVWGVIKGAKENGTSTNTAGYLAFATSNHAAGALVEAARIDSSGNLLVGKTAAGLATAGVALLASGSVEMTRSAEDILNINRLTNDGKLVRFWQDTTEEGNISVSGTTVSYNGGHLSRSAQTTTAKDDSLLKGTVLSNLDEMNVYIKDGQPVDNEQLNKVKVSDVEGDANVAGVFVNWSHDEQHNVDEINMAMTGDMIIRIAQGVTVVRGDLLMSAGDGTAKPQGDDIVRSKTVAKVTSNHITCTYADGSYCVPCVLMAC